MTLINDWQMRQNRYQIPELETHTLCFLISYGTLECKANKQSKNIFILYICLLSGCCVERQTTHLFPPPKLSTHRSCCHFQLLLSFTTDPCIDRHCSQCGAAEQRSGDCRGSRRVPLADFIAQCLCYRKCLWRAECRRTDWTFSANPGSRLKQSFKHQLVS